MHVAGILNDKGGAVITMGPRSTVKEAIALMAQKRIGAVVIVGVENAVLGMFSERDVVRVLAQKGPEALADDLGRHMTSPVFTCTVLLISNALPVKPMNMKTTPTCTR